MSRSDLNPVGGASCPAVMVLENTTDFFLENSVSSVAEKRLLILIVYYSNRF